MDPHRKVEYDERHLFAFQRSDAAGRRMGRGYDVKLACPSIRETSDGGLLACSAVLATFMWVDDDHRDFVSEGRLAWETNGQAANGWVLARWTNAAADPCSEEYLARGGDPQQGRRSVSFVCRRCGWRGSRKERVVHERLTWARLSGLHKVKLSS